MFQESFNGLSGKLHGCYMKVLRKIERCFEVVLRVFQESFKDVSNKFYGCLEEASRVFRGGFKGVSRKFPGCFKKVSRTFQQSFILHDTHRRLQLPEQREGLF